MRHVFPAVLILLVAPPAAAQDAGTVFEGEDLFMDYCAACHGAEARGDGPLSEVLSVPVPDLTALAAQQGGFPHYDVISKIDGRDPMISHGAVMPVWGPAFEGVESTFVRTAGGQPIMTSPAIAALTEWLEAVQE